MQGGFNHGSDLFIANPGNAPGPRSIFLQSGEAQSQKALAPELHSGPRNLQALGNVLAIHSIGSHLDDLCTLDNPKGHCPAARPLVYDGAFLRGKYDSGGFSAHNARSYKKEYYMSSYF